MYSRPRYTLLEASTRSGSDLSAWLPWSINAAACRDDDRVPLPRLHDGREPMPPARRTDEPQGRIAMIVFTCAPLRAADGGRAGTPPRDARARKQTLESSSPATTTSATRPSPAGIHRRNLASSALPGRPPDGRSSAGACPENNNPPPHSRSREPRSRTRLRRGTSGRPLRSNWKQGETNPIYVTYPMGWATPPPAENRFLPQ